VPFALLPIVLIINILIIISYTNVSNVLINIPIKILITNICIIIATTATTTTATATGRLNEITYGNHMFSLTIGDDGSRQVASEASIFIWLAVLCS